jgi:tripartite-type tricarboxylate transporter receptor subunit TctC
MALSKSKCLLWMVAFSCGLMIGQTTQAQVDFPNRPARIVVASVAGGILDTVARTIAQGLSVNTAQQFVVENRAGAGGLIGTEYVVKAAPDGYTAGHIATSHAINPAVYAKMPYDTLRDLAAVAQTVNLTNLLVVQSSFPANNLLELIALAKTQPGKLTFGSAGVGQSNHLSGEIFKQMAGIDLVHVPYKGSAPALIDLLAGTTSMMFVDALSAMPHIQSGKLKVIAATGLKRSTSLPQYPTLNESGLPGFNGNSWLGLVLPAGTPSAIVAQLSAQVSKVLNQPEMRAKLLSQGVEPVGSTPSEFKAFLEVEIKRYGEAAKAANIQPQ